MTIFRALLLAVLVPSCWAIDAGDDFSPPDPGDDPPCSTCDPDREVDLGIDRRFAAGTTLSFYPPAGTLLGGIDVTSSDPGVISVSEVRDREITIVGHSSGRATLTAKRRGTTLDTIEITTVPVARIDLFFRAAPGASGADEPVTTLAGMAGRADSIGVSYHAADGELLVGRGDFTVRGGTAVTITGNQGERLSEAFADRSAHVELLFAQLGTVELVASVRGGPERILPIEVVTAPASVGLVAMVLRDWELVAAPDPVIVGEYVGVDVIGRTADGRFVSGVYATWTWSGDLTILAGTSPSTELVFDISSAGAAQITATVGSATAQVSLTAE